MEYKRNKKNELLRIIFLICFERVPVQQIKHPDTRRETRHCFARDVGMFL